MTELIWDGKYKDGKKVSPVRIALPFQTIETVNESSQERQKSLDFFSNGQPTEWRNRLIWGDKKYILPSLLPEFAGKVNLIYIDPPFNVGADFSFKTTIPDNPETDEDETIEFVKQPSVIEQKAYRDTWGKGLDSYLQWFYETAILLRELLTEDGSLYVHLDWHVGQYAKIVLDEIFGYESFFNELVWQKIRSSKAQSKSFGNVHDIIYGYSKTENYFFNQLYVPLSKERVDKHYNNVEKDGRRFQLCDFTQSGQGVARKFGKKTLEPPKGKHWIWNQENIDSGMKEGLIVFTSSGMLRLKRYLDNSKGNPLEDIWTDIAPVNSMAAERVDYATQKPEALLERIFNASTKENDLVLDCFIGSGTTASTAEKMNRRWIGCDLGRFSIHTTRKRLLGIKDVKPFIIQNLGKYERQQWIKAEFDDNETKSNQEKNYHKFILDLYLAQSLSGYTWLHGNKAGRMVHVGSVDAPISIGDVKSIIQEFWKLVGKDEKIKTNGIDVLGWEFAFDLNETAKQFAAANKVDLKFKKIPKEVLEKRAVEQGDIQFFELASLDVKVKKEKKKVALTLNNFNIPQDDIPDEVRSSISHWSQFIDYWAVDWNYRDDTFHNEWQTYRTRKNTSIELGVSNAYDEKGEFVVVVKVIDILGNDTTKAINIEIK